MSSRYVKIHYGPCECFYTFAHRPQRLKALRVSLQKLGFRVDLVPIDLIEACIIEMCGHEVFRCNIKNMQFNMMKLQSSAHERAVTAVTEAAVKMERARNYLWAWMLIEHQMFNNEYSPKNYWNLDSAFKPMGRTCADCCHIILAGQPDETVTDKAVDRFDKYLQPL